MAGPQTGTPGGHGHAHGHAHGHGPGEAHAHDEHGFLETVRAIGTEQGRRRRRLVALAGVFAVAGATGLAEWLARSAPATPAWTAADCPAPAGLLEPDADPVLRYSIAGDALLAAPEGERSVLLLGGGDVLGPELDPDRGPAPRLAARLGTEGRPWRGLALGAPGWTAGQAVRAFERAADALAPDLVVLDLAEEMVDTQGAFVDRHGLAHRDFLPLPGALKRLLWRKSALYGRLARAHANAVLDVADPASDARPPSAFARPENQGAAADAVARLAELCRARGTPLLVAFRTRLPCGPGQAGSERAREMETRLAASGAALTSGCAPLPDPGALRAALERAGLLP